MFRKPAREEVPRDRNFWIGKEFFRYECLIFFFCSSSFLKMINKNFTGSIHWGSRDWDYFIWVRGNHQVSREDICCLMGLSFTFIGGRNVLRCLYRTNFCFLKFVCAVSHHLEFAIFDNKYLWIFPSQTHCLDSVAYLSISHFVFNVKMKS